MADVTQATLSNQAIESAIDSFTSTLDKASVPKRLVTQSTILMEELLLRYQERFGADTEFSFFAVRRLGTFQLHIEVRGEQFNALDSTMADEKLGYEHDLISELMEGEIEPPAYRYKGGRNIIALNVRALKQRPIWANPMLIATVVSVLAFLILSRVNGELVSTLTDNLISPVVSTLMGVLKAITGPLLCLSLISGICALGDVATLKSVGKHALLRIVVWVAILIALSMVACKFIFPGMSGQSGAEFNGRELFELLLSSIPTNFFTPFVEGNMLQIVVESVFVGLCLLALGERSERIRSLVIELNSLVFKMMYLFSEALPLLVGLSLFATLATTDLSGIGQIGLVVAANLGLMGVFSVGTLLWVWWTLRVPIPVFIKKLMPGLAICLATGSSTSAMGEFYRIPREELGVSETIVNFWVPLGHAMFSPSTIVPLVVSAFAVASLDGVQIDATKLAIIALLVLQLSITTPKVPGGIAATYTILLAQLGLSLDAVGLLMAANVIICNPCVVFGDLIRYAEIVAFAESEDALDKDQLRAA